MIIIDGINKSLVLYLGGSITTRQWSWSCSFIEQAQMCGLTTTQLTEKTGHETDGATNNTTKVTMIQGSNLDPDAVTTDAYGAIGISICNVDTVTNTLYVAVDDNGQYRVIFSAIMPPGSCATYTNVGGWQVTDAGGAPFGTSGYSGYSGFSGVGSGGASGFSGYSGSSGNSGFSGVSGYSGYSGVSGFTGVSGYSGVSGAHNIANFGVSLDGNSAVITTGVANYMVIPYSCTITGWSITADQTSPTITYDIWKIASGTALPTVSNSIVNNGAGGAYPALATGNVIESTTLTHWTTAVTAGDIVGFNVNAATVCTVSTLQVTVSVP